MARRSGIEGFLRAAVRATAQAARQADTDRRRALQAQERNRRFSAQQQRYLERMEAADSRTREKERKLLEKADKEAYLKDRQAEAESLTLQAAQTVEELSGILAATLSRDDTIDFKDLLVTDPPPPLILPPELRVELPAPDRGAFFSGVKQPSFLERTLGMTQRFDRERSAAESAYGNAVEEWKLQSHQRMVEVSRLREVHANECNAHARRCDDRAKEVTQLEELYREGDAEAVVLYNEMVLQRSSYPEGFPDWRRVAYAKDSRQLVVELDVPNYDIVPVNSEYRYVKARDSIDSKARKATEIAALYRSVIAQTALRTLHEVFEADQGSHIDLCVCSLFVHRVDPATGRDARPCLLSVRADKNSFVDINLERVDPVQCLRNLGASVSPKPEEAQAVKPVIEFSMVDPRFIEQGDALAGLDARPNLMDLSPGDFEVLVSNLFGKMGLETKLTRSSRDGGVDAVAFDSRPVLGGKVVIQAKRYRHTVGVSAVRDLYGTMLNEGASKGILVTTSSYGTDAYKFANGKPIELIDGGGLLYLLADVGTEARIIMPGGNS